MKYLDQPNLAYKPTINKNSYEIATDASQFAAGLSSVRDDKPV